MALIAGLLGGVFGIGGGMLISPFLLQIGIDPQVRTYKYIYLTSYFIISILYIYDAN